MPNKNLPTQINEQINDAQEAILLSRYDLAITCLQLSVQLIKQLKNQQPNES